MSPGNINVYLFGTNSVARMLAGLLHNDARYSLLGYTLNSEYCGDKRFFDLPLVPFEELSVRKRKFGIINCVGYSKQLSNREAVDEQILAKQIPLLPYIHPSADVLGVEFGEGNLVLPRAVIEQYSKVGDGNLFYGGSYICHDAVIGNHNWFSACCTLAGNITVGNRNFIGINSSVREYLTIGDGTTIGASAVLIRDVPNNAVVVGNPAIIKRYHER
jgi:sugar O-acyltransferase (sialic acid O-acetyltransferase NeuD family)